MLSLRGIRALGRLGWRTRFPFCKNVEKERTLEEEHVYKVYDKIAQHFSQTRYKPWPRVANFLQHLKKGSIVLDIGCGNGRNMHVNSTLQIIGLDRCFPLLSIASQRKQKAQVLQADATKLPIRSQSCDAFISIALLHHFSTENMRLEAIREFGRVTKAGGYGLIYVRSLEVMNNRGELVRELPGQDFFEPWHLQQKYEKDLEKAIEEGHEYIAQKNSIIYQRFYHAFVQGQLEQLIKASQAFEIKKSYYDKSNWACIVTKR